MHDQVTVSPKSMTDRLSEVTLGNDAAERHAVVIFGACSYG
jgi:hypothetical protein